MSDSLVNPWMVTCLVPLSMRFPRQEYWSGLPFPFPGDLPDPGIEPRTPALQADALTSEPRGNHAITPAYHQPPKSDIIIPILQTKKLRVRVSVTCSEAQNLKANSVCFLTGSSS